jgi:hypothetical protein
MESSVNSISMKTGKAGNMVSDILASQMVGHFYGSGLPVTGIWEVVDNAGKSVMARGAEIASAGAAGTLVVHPINSVDTNGDRVWYTLELVPGTAKGCIFDAINCATSTAVKSDVCIIL